MDLVDVLLALEGRVDVGARELGQLLDASVDEVSERLGQAYRRGYVVRRSIGGKFLYTRDPGVPLPTPMRFHPARSPGTEVVV